MFEAKKARQLTALTLESVFLLSSCRFPTPTPNPEIENIKSSQTSVVASLTSAVGSLTSEVAKRQATQTAVFTQTIFPLETKQAEILVTVNGLQTKVASIQSTAGLPTNTPIPSETPHP